MNEGFVVTASGAYRPRPARVTVIAGPDVMGVQEFVASPVIHTAFLHLAQLAHSRIDKAVAQIDIASGADPQETKAGTAWIRLADAGVQFLQCVIHIREPVVAATERPITIFPGEFFES